MLGFITQFEAFQDDLMKVSISLGGSLLTRDQDPENFFLYARTLKHLKAEGHKLVVVCGGGKTARNYIKTGQMLGASSTLQDRLGILATHVNALFLISALGEDAHNHVHKRGVEIKRNLDGKILVGGGYLPGASTDYRAVQFAEAMDGDLIVNATDYGGIFDKDPSKFTDAKKIDLCSYDCLERIINERFEQKPGDYGLFDLKAVRLASKRRLPIVFIDGTDPKEIIRAVEGGHNGTTVCEC
jgi:uridylate kinase